MTASSKSPDEYLSAEITALQPAVNQRLIEQMLHGEEPPSVWELEPGENMFKQGNLAQAVHLVLEGEVVVKVDGAEIARLGAGSVVGEMAMLGNRQRTGTVTATTRTTVASLGESRFDREDLRALAGVRRG